MDTKNIIATLSQSLLDEVKKVMKKKGEKDESPAHEKSEKEDCSEALKGNQHKIDANKNGKVDAHDFKLLRKKKGVAETYADIQSGEDISEEDVEEAVKNPYAVGMAAAMKSTGDKPPLDKSTITKAHDIAKKIKEDTEEVSEESEQIDELSTNTVKSYKKAALKSSPPESVFSNAKKYKQRTKGITMAQNRLNKEEVEEIDEISSDMAHRYLKGKHERDYNTSADGKSSSLKKPQSFDKMNKDMKSTARALRTIEKAKKANEDVEHTNCGTPECCGQCDTAEQIDEVSKATLGRYINKAKDSIDTASYRQGHKEAHGSSSKPLEKKLTKRHKGIETAVKKLTKEDAEIELTQEEIDRIEATLADLDEGRGRPPKEGSDAWKKRQQAGAAEQDEPRQHPIQQLERIKRDMRGGADFKHRDGSSHHMTGGQAANLLSKYHGLRPAEKEVMQKEIHGSHAGLKKHL